MRRRREAEVHRCHGRVATIVGTAGDDVLQGTPGRDVIWGGPGNDTIYGKLGNDLICGGGGDDVIHGGRGNDEVFGGQGTDRVFGDLGDDKVVGGPGSYDDVSGGLGIDTVNGGPGDYDLVHGDYGWDRMSGGPGKHDIASFATSVSLDGTSGVWASLRDHAARGDGHDELFEFEDLEGSAFEDTLIGNGGPNVIKGGPGNDTLIGGDAQHQTGEHELDRTMSREPRTTVPADTLRSLNEQLLRVPNGFTVHRKLGPQLEKRRKTLGEEGGIDWAQAEALSYASLLALGVPIRLTGQDSERGTFSQRHLVLHDSKTGDRFAPIQNLRDAHAPFELHNSPLSEQACLGFEYGYSVQASDALVLWEAQFGDFVNGAQVVIDQFLVSGLAKWGQTSRLTLLLPHGYEGSGPEHSSARLERFLQLAAEGNIRVANPTTPAQYFHLLRRQALVGKARPLVVMTPKSLLRLPAATSTLEELADGAWQRVIGDPDARPREGDQAGALLGQGLLRHRRPRGARRRRAHRGRARGAALPVPGGRPRRAHAEYPNLERVVWVQEEPRNMGARAYMRRKMAEILPRTSPTTTSAASSAPHRARATPRPTSASSRASCAWRSTSRRTRSTRTSPRSARSSARPRASTRSRGTDRPLALARLGAGHLVRDLVRAQLALQGRRGPGGQLVRPGAQAQRQRRHVDLGLVVAPPR